MLPWQPMRGLPTGDCSQSSQKSTKKFAKSNFFLHFFSYAKFHRIWSRSSGVVIIICHSHCYFEIFIYPVSIATSTTIPRIETFLFLTILKHVLDEPDFNNVNNKCSLFKSASPSCSRFCIFKILFLLLLFHNLVKLV